MRARLLTLLGFLLAIAACRSDSGPQETLLIAGNAALTRYLEPLIKAFLAKNPGGGIIVSRGEGSNSVKDHFKLQIANFKLQIERSHLSLCEREQARRKARLHRDRAKAGARPRGLMFEITSRSASVAPAAG